MHEVRLAPRAARDAIDSMQTEFSELERRIRQLGIEREALRKEVGG